MSGLFLITKVDNTSFVVTQISLALFWLNGFVNLMGVIPSGFELGDKIIMLLLAEIRNTYGHLGFRPEMKIEKENKNIGKYGTHKAWQWVKGYNHNQANAKRSNFFHWIAYIEFFVTLVCLVDMAFRLFLRYESTDRHNNQ